LQPETPSAAHTPARLTLRGGVGPEQPEWDDVETYSAEWYTRVRAWHHAAFPDSDASTRDNLDMFVRRAKNRVLR
jgi:hypothetical protein